MGPCSCVVPIGMGHITGAFSLATPSTHLLQPQPSPAPALQTAPLPGQPSACSRYGIQESIGCG